MSANVARILRALHEEAEAHGCEIEVLRGAHIKVRLLRGGQILATTTLSTTPRNRRYKEPAPYLLWLRKALKR